MTALVLGATGMTGRQVVRQLVSRNVDVKIVVRDVAKAHQLFPERDRLTVMEGNVLEMTDDEIQQCTHGCEAILSCLGHSLTWEGLFGRPHCLVSDTARLLCSSILSNSSGKGIRFILMSTTANLNKDADERHTLVEKVILFLVRSLLPPQRDNEQASEYLRSTIGTGQKKIEWTQVRPDRLVDEGKTSEYEAVASPTQSALFGKGTTSRINVAAFMADLTVENATWNRWKFQMPVLYNRMRAPTDTISQ